MRALRKNRGPPGPKVKGGLPLKNIKLKGTGVKPRAVKSRTPIPRAAMKNLWLKSRDKAALSIKEASFHQRDQPSNTPGNQAADQMVEITVKAPAEAVYRAGKKSAQDAAHKLKERRETIKTAQAVQEKMSAEENSYQTGETTSTPDATPISSSNKSVQERQ